MGAVGGNQIGRRDGLFGAVTAAQLHTDVFGSPRHRDQLDPTFDFDALPVELFGQQPFGLRLSQQQNVVEFTWYSV